MREIEFRGKQLDSGEWVYGAPVYSKEKILCQMIWYENFGAGEMPMCKEIDPATVGEFAGLVDKNGAKIWEGDKARVTRFAILAYGEITFNNGCFWFKDDGPGGLLRLCDIKINNYEIEVIGTIHDPITTPASS